MVQMLIPRLPVAVALKRFSEVQDLLAKGGIPHLLPAYSYSGAQPNPTGGSVAGESTLRSWRGEVMEKLHDVDASSRDFENRHSLVLGRALAEVIAPVPADVGHDGVWSFLSLVVFPDVVARRWFTPGQALSRHRWVGNQVGQDRNYLKLAWRRWEVLGDVMERARPLLGEDEFGALLERSSLARNKRLIRASAERIIGFDSVAAKVKGGRSKYARILMKRINFRTGSRMLDLLDSNALQAVVDEAAEEAYKEMGSA